MTSMPASRSARAMTFAPRSCSSRPGFATRTRMGRSLMRAILPRRRRVKWSFEESCRAWATSSSKKKLITDEQRNRAVLRQVRQRGRIGTALLEEEASEEIILHGLSVQHRVPPASPEALEEIRADVLRLVPGRVAQRLHAVPFRRDGRSLAIAMRDPGDLPALDELTALTGFRIVPHAALEVRIYALLYRYYAADVEPRYLSAAAFLRETQSASEADCVSRR